MFMKKEKWVLILGLLMIAVAQMFADNPCVTNYKNMWIYAPIGEISATALPYYKVNDQITITAQATWSAGQTFSRDQNGCEPDTNFVYVQATPVNWWTLQYGNEPATVHNGSGLTASFKVTNGYNIVLIFYTSNHTAAASPAIDNYFTTSVSFPVYELRTTTEATEPSYRSRKTIGVGEVVSLMLIPGNTLMWELSGSGSLDTDDYNPAIYTAPSYESRATITVISDDGFSDSATFTTIKPSNLLFVDNTIMSGLCPPSRPDAFSIYYTASVYAQPDSVHFYNIIFAESAGGPVKTGFYVNKTLPSHTAWNGQSVAGYYAGRGSYMAGVDNISMSATPNPFSTGTVIYSLGWSYYVNGLGDGSTIQTINQGAAISLTNSNNYIITVTKGQSGAYIRTGDTTATFQ